MRLSSVLAASFAALVSAHAFAQTTTTAINVTWTNNNGGCSFFQGQRDISFQDTAGSNWTYLKIRVPMAVTQTVNGQPATPAQVYVSIDGVRVGDPVLVSNDGTFCGNLQVYEFGTAALPGYHAFAANTFSITGSGGYFGGAPAELIFTTEPRKFAFDLVPAMSQKVILHPDPGDTNLSPWQVITNLNEKPRFRFHGAVTSNTASPEADVWLRVVDPPDPSPYLPQHSPDDNEDPLKQGVLMPRGCATAACRALPGQPLQVHSSPGGVVDLELEATDRYAGDNYYLEASFDSGFTCATAGANGASICARSGLVTAWKRVFIEKRRMLRNGLFLAANAQAGDTFLITRGNHWMGNRGDRAHLSKSDKIVIVHAPQFDRSDLTGGWYSEVHTILSVQDLGNGQFRVNLGTKQGNTTIPEPLQHGYSVDQHNADIGDAISKLDSLSVTASDVFDAPMDLVTGAAFLDSFTENILLPDNTTPGANVPVPFLETSEQFLLQDLAEKWSSVVNGTLAPNHQLLIIASDNNDQEEGDLAGLTITTAGSGRSSSWVFWESIEQILNRHNNADTVNTWAKKTSAHEIAHQWQTNGFWNPFDHCPTTTKVWNDPSVYCLLADADANGAGSVAQRTNGIARFHFLTLPGGGTHSEYLEIRRRADPFVP